MKEFEIPTDQNPFELDKDCIFYSDHYIVDGQEVLYDDVAQIIWNNARQSMNGFQINSKSDYLVVATKKDYLVPPAGTLTEEQIEKEELLYACDDFSFQTGIIKTHRNFLKRQKFIHHFLFERTKKSRLTKTLNSLKKDGFIEIYAGAKLFDNGDMIINGKMQGNFRDKFKSGEIITGVKYGGYSNNVSDPYEFGFKKGRKFLGLVEDNFVFRNVTNTDVFDILFSNLFKNGNLSKF
ncbi:MAG: hypothetical protein ACK5MD_10475 [Flavobacteriales bacterium]